MRTRLGEALGPGFQIGARMPAASSTYSSLGTVISWSRAAWLGLGTIVALGLVASWSARPPEPGPTALKPAAEQRLHPSAALPALPAPQVARTELASEQALPASAPQVARTESSSEQALRAPQVARTEPAREPALRAVLSPAASGRAVAVVDRGLAEELRQLEHARRLLHTSPQRALAAVRIQSRRFSHGALGAERDLVRIDALLRLGRAEDAQRLAERVLGVPDNHPYRVQIETLLSRSPSAAER
jgi:hypothetical protein